MPIFSPEKALRDLPKTPVILNVILHGIEQERALEATDGPDGWSVLEILCHLNDFEEFFVTRAQKIVETDLPKFPPIDHEALVIENQYKEQNFEDVFVVYVRRRRAFVKYLRGLTPEQWQRTGDHPSWGIITLVEHVINVTLHDVNHIEQIIKALGTSETLDTLGGL